MDQFGNSVVAAKPGHNMPDLNNIQPIGPSSRLRPSQLRRCRVSQPHSCTVPLVRSNICKVHNCIPGAMFVVVADKYNLNIALFMIDKVRLTKKGTGK